MIVVYYLSPPSGEAERHLVSMAGVRRGVYSEVTPTIKIEGETPSSGSPTHVINGNDAEHGEYISMEMEPTPNGASRCEYI